MRRNALRASYTRFMGQGIVLHLFALKTRLWGLYAFTGIPQGERQRGSGGGLMALKIRLDKKRAAVDGGKAAKEWGKYAID